MKEKTNNKEGEIPVENMGPVRSLCDSIRELEKTRLEGTNVDLNPLLRFYQLRSLNGVN